MKNKSVSTKLSKTAKKDLSKWEEAITEAKERIQTLKRSIHTLEELRDSGMPWPGSEKRNGVVNDVFKRDASEASV